MRKTKIEWTDYSLNPVKGLCPVDCKDNQGKSYCYARAMYKRFKWNSELQLELSVFDKLPKKPSRIFVGSTIELFHDAIPDDWRWGILRYCQSHTEHIFIFLTKQPQNLIKWSPFPKNCWVGVTATSHEQWKDGVKALRSIEATVKFFSFEPLLHRIGVKFYDFDADVGWLIIGQQTPISAKTQPKIEWIQEIVEAADKADIPVFLKNNLATILPTGENWCNIGGEDEGDVLRQEFPR